MTTRQALQSGERGECDVVLVHDRSEELQFVQSGQGSLRREVMHDDYILVGPEEDPAKINGMHDVRAALRKIAEAEARFVSRGDGSDTDTAEREAWTEALGSSGLLINAWHLETRSSMQQTLAAAASMSGYALADRATWVKFSDRHHLKIVVEGDPRMIDQYSAILVNPATHPQVKADLGMKLIDWLTSPEGRETIASYKIDGEELFFPEGKP
jgi:tungstate transport system substrate-binding protein